VALFAARLLPLMHKLAAVASHFCVLMELWWAIVAHNVSSDQKEFFYPNLWWPVLNSGKVWLTWGFT